MKRILQIAMLLLLSTACNKPDEIPETRQSYLVKHSWDYTTMWVNGSQETLDPCLVDDIWTFSGSNSLLVNYGNIKCNLSQPGSASGTYVLSPDQNSLYMTYGGTTVNYHVNLIDEYNLDISEWNGVDSVRYRLNAR
jgi:hypothetical protein